MKFWSTSKDVLFSESANPWIESVGPYTEPWVNIEALPDGALCIAMRNEELYVPPEAAEELYQFLKAQRKAHKKRAKP